ncbi:hypothetical protein EPJ64_04210 [Brachyspira aalborgi]|jgi:hypothetical protein|uniref:Uncharacterized protein n=1 Tax=Brachyspira aalborgi TaxID=29522 RepID=A0AB38Q0S8_9SPIR|nr:hypothetical protein [Brachyspira aalborgi]MBS4762831.1 hypothetical protein [Brachyspira sp.]CCY75333.1 unknown [Brachyspira sp. CAG:700]TXJ15838.1 hypothetical protein EPJ77_04225 [Brachyspira aalborgi]TXJ19339.1 hypothetical protein EPJ64_04210 [Brachyspira aalborgi]TXJ26093.1 hypothetical protein EPJ73_04585 [Brachyspira aalborgi]
MSKEIVGIIYEKAIEARAKISGLINLHLLIGKSKDDDLYRALCLDSGIICISSSKVLNKETIDYLFENSCIMALNQFYRAVKNGEENVLSGRYLDREYWETYDKLILEVKNNTLNKILKVLNSSEGKTEIKDIQNLPYIKGYDLSNLLEGNNSIFYLLNMLEQILFKNNTSFLENLYEKEVA